MLMNLMLIESKLSLKSGNYCTSDRQFFIFTKDMQEYNVTEFRFNTIHVIPFFKFFNENKFKSHYFFNLIVNR